ncbi:MAG: phasin family protein [Rhodobacteraceae bacterium]|nr:phasin family protein [Paracoccaceae bacterium]
MAADKTLPNPFAMFTAKPEAMDMGDGATAAVRAQARMMDAVLKQNIEVLDFLKQRYEKDRALFSSLATIENPNDIMTVWSGFWQKAMSDYSNEAGKLGALAAATTEQMLSSAGAEALMPSLPKGKKKG